MNISSYFLNKPQLAEAVKAFFSNELFLELKDKVEQPLVTSQIFGKEFRFLDQIEHLYFCGGISDQTFQQGEDKSWQELAEKVKYNALLVFAIQLKKHSPSRTLLSEITRKLNRVSNGAPVVVLFRYEECLSLATCERVTKKTGDGEKVGKVSLLKDLDLRNPHAGHLRILQDLRVSKGGKKAVTTFDQLYGQWLSVFNLKVLNEKFYQELFHWYLWALRTVKIPPKPKGEKLEEEALKSIFVIRLITRLMFVWFVKEKKLISEKLFHIEELANHIKKFDPVSCDTSKYYRAILQNLFFATLNTPLRKEAKDETEVRRFIDLAKKGNKGYSDGYTDQTLYRYEDYFKDSPKALALFDTIPFLNGGLFECLDFPENKNTGESERRYDGFSSVKEKQAFVPEALFFGNETELDITQDLEAEKEKGKTVRRLVKVRGLIHTLNDYKFTIAENTPLEEEIALDPELLGRVFENLLASYNPETKATARKRTGSFYTPREIVNYMVDESLKAYLFQRLLHGPAAFVELGNKQTQMFANEAIKGQTALLQEVAVDEDLKQKYTAQLETFFDYSQEGNPFNEEDTAILIRAISDCKILDPACGSGAFPMGILHRMVNLLAKLDPNNNKWKHELLRKAELDLKTAREHFRDDTIKRLSMENAENRIKYIKESFENPRHELDYSRKLFLIEHCIYGVDIQQIAVQIAKLRFFISLMVDQHVHDSKPNRNILSMPNLETKFVAANSLISLDQNVGTKKGVVGSGLFRSREVEHLEEQLKELRKDIFYTRKYSAKKALKADEEKLRTNLKAALKASGYNERSAQQMADWNPFDPIHSAGFFDQEIMFFKDGFDIVIGNPPYIQLQKDGGELAHLYAAANYQTFDRMGDIYSLFYERGWQVLKPNGNLCYITSNKWMRAGYGQATRRFLAENTNPTLLVDFPEQKIFESATVVANILLFNKAKNKGQTFACTVTENVINNLSVFVMQNGVTCRFQTSESWAILSAVEQRIKEKIELIGTPLREWPIAINYGVKTGLNDAFIITGKQRSDMIRLDPKSGEIIRPLLRGRDIKRYEYRFADLWLINSHNGRKEKGVKPINIDSYPAIKKHLDQYYSELEKRADRGDTPYNLRNCAYMDDFSKQKIVWGNLNLRAAYTLAEGGMFVNAPCPMIVPGNLFLLAVLNSTLGDYYVRSLGVIRNGGYFEYKPMFIEQLPVPHIEVAEQKPFADLAFAILETKKIKKNSNELEMRLDQMIFELYNLSNEEIDFLLSDRSKIEIANDADLLWR